MRDDGGPIRGARVGALDPGPHSLAVAMVSADGTIAVDARAFMVAD